MAGAPNPAGPVTCQRGKGRLQVRVEGGLVVLDRQQVVPALVDHLLGHLPLRQQGIGGYQPACERHLRQ